MRIRNTETLLGYIGILVVFGVTLRNMLPVYLQEMSLDWFYTPWASLISALFGRQAFEIYLLSYVLTAFVFMLILWQLTCAKRVFAIAQQKMAIAALLSIGLVIDADWLVLASLVLGFYLPARQAVYWLLVMCLVFALIVVGYCFGWLGKIQPINMPGILVSGGMQLIWYIAAFGFGYLAASELRGRLKLAAAHAELLATQQLLTATVTSSERLRIARNLHDSIGHHLTALNLHLELAQRQAEPQAALQTAQQLAQELLTDVRSVVNVERSEAVIDLKQALLTLSAGIKQPEVVLDYDERLVFSQPSLAHVIFRCVQEGLTNALRHAQASRIQIQLQRQQRQLMVYIRDNGKGVTSMQMGNGLNGMQERLTEFNAQLNWSTPDEGGFLLQIAFPLWQA